MEMEKSQHKNQDLRIIKTGGGRCRLSAKILPMGDHLLIAVSGGDAHIGAVALAEPYPGKTDPKKMNASVSVLCRTTHKEDIIANKMASILSSTIRVPVLVCCGIHLEKITNDEIKKIISNSKILSKKIINVLDRNDNNT